METLKFNFKLEENINITESSIDELNEVKSPAIDKVLRVLRQIKIHLDTTLASRELVKSLIWAINKIETNSLYTSSIDEIDDEEDNQNIEEKEFLENFQEASFVNSIHKFNRERVISKTEHLNPEIMKKVRDDLNLKEKPKVNKSIIKEEDEFDSPNKKATGKEIKKNDSIFANGKVDLLSDILQVEVNENNRYETINDEELINYSIDNLEKLDKDDMEIKDIKERYENFNMNNIVSRTFNIYKFESIFGREKSFILIGKEIFRSLDVINMIDTTKLDMFLIELRNNYISSNPYHNERHGADVGQTTATILKESEIINFCFLYDLDILSVLISAIAHDVGHPGMNNNFQINSRSEVALTYHDKSVLENLHIFLLFKILKKPECNIINELKKEDYNIFRKRVIEAILATDMFFHSKLVSALNNRFFTYKENLKTNPDELLINPNSKTLFDDQQEVINLLVHAADISHNTKPFKISEKWTYFLTEEFHLQGDKEKSLNLPISFLCDRNTSNVPKSQVGFINFAIAPTFEILAAVFPSMKYLVDNAKENVATWDRLHKESEEKNK